MKIFIADINEISKNRLMLDDYIKRLTPSDLKRYNDINAKARKLQFLVGRMLIYENLGYDFKINKSGKIISKKSYLSLAHSQDKVVLALSKNKVGIDVEYISKTRQTKDIAKYLGFTDCQDNLDFYKQFTAYEADYKSSLKTQNITHNWFILNDYLICVSSFGNSKISTYQTIPFLKREEITLKTLLEK